MTDPLKRIPKVGDRVGALGIDGTFEVIAVHTKNMTVDLKLIAPVAAEHYERDIPLGVLIFLDGNERLENA